ncbi:MAG: dihydroorotase [Cytophagales bacterium]
MRLLIKNAKLVFPKHHLNQQLLNILIEDGKIDYIGSDLTEADEVFEAENLHLSPGWFDMRANFSDPGFEHKEDLKSGVQAAIQGGFTEICVLPDTQPALDSKDVVEYVLSKTRNAKVKIRPLGFASVHGKGNDMAELMDLHHAGVIAFTDAYKWIAHSGLLSQILQYLQMFDGLLINRPNDLSISPFGLMNESKTSVLLGLKGIPKLAEEIAIMRDLEILKYTGGKIHFSLISTAKSVDLIRKAKKEGLNVTCDTAPHYLAFEDTALASFETNLKVMPPFREKEDVLALVEGLLDGTIDCLVSDHHPQDVESKNLEFDLAEFGISAIETAFAVSNTFHPNKLEIEILVEKWALNPRKILGLEIPKFEPGSVANLTLFDPEKSWQPESALLKSKSKNNPFLGTHLKGKVLGTIIEHHINYL